MMFHAVQIKAVTSFGDTASCRILNTTNINDSSNQLSCTAYMLRNKDKPVKCQLQLPTKHELYMPGRGTINTNCEENYMTARTSRSLKERAKEHEADVRLRRDKPISEHFNGAGHRVQDMGVSVLTQIREILISLVRPRGLREDEEGLEWLGEEGRKQRKSSRLNRPDQQQILMGGNGGPSGLMRIPSTRRPLRQMQGYAISLCITLTPQKLRYNMMNQS
ncbi:hypothetical protein DPMN_034178 [Dreissena polymorpha]|uniref:Uncharacterized protein n=1 Tax=Dreissena polymorpha TaxID=45954 RepID=A0A9D4M847_DREPO|nr:hypothetical protein DPMN_034178 [Dreissena polymorpha]